MPRDQEYPSGHKNPAERQQKVLDALAAVGREGLTSREMAEAEAPGDVSGTSGWGGCFTVLHQDKLISALTELREGYHVYVLKEYLDGRQTWPGYRHKGTKVVVITRTIPIHCSTCTCKEN